MDEKKARWCEKELVKRSLRRADFWLCAAAALGIAFWLQMQMARGGGADVKMLPCAALRINSAEFLFGWHALDTVFFGGLFFYLFYLLPPRLACAKINSFNKADCGETDCVFTFGIRQNEHRRKIWDGHSAFQ